MKNIIIHIAGPSGSGKTTIGNKLQEAYGDKIMVKDTDRLRTEHRNEKTMDLQNYIYQFINNNASKPIIFVGLNSASNKLLDLKADYKFYIDLPLEQVLRQKFYRSVANMYNNKEHLFTEYLADPHKTQEYLFYLVNFVRWKREIDEDNKLYQRYGYDFKTPDKIMEKIDAILKQSGGFTYKYRKYKTKYISLKQTGGGYHLNKITDRDTIKKILPQINDKKMDLYPGTDYYFYYLDNDLIGYVFLQQAQPGYHPVIEEAMNGRIHVWGVEILEPFRGQGYGYQMLSQVLDDNHQYFLRVQKDNIAAIKLYQKLGFTFYKENVITLPDGNKLIRDIMVRKMN